MKIVYLYDSLAIWGGIERVLIDKMNYFADKDGYDVYIITANQGNHPIPYNLDDSITHIDLKIGFHNKYRYSGVKRLREGIRLINQYHSSLKNLLKDISPDLLICTTAQDVYSLLKLKGNIPLIVEAHSNFIHPDKFWSRMKMLINNYWIGKADAVVTLTEGDAKKWRTVCNNVYVIPNIVHLNNTNRFTDCKSKRAIFVGRFTYQKGIADLFEIWQTVYKKHKDWSLDLYGEGELWDEYKGMAERLDANININKPVADIFKEYTSSSILLVTSLFEPFGLVIAEAMSCGLPVIAYDCPYGPSEIISHQVDGILVPRKNKEAFAKHLDSVMSDYDMRLRMSEVARKSVQRYSVESIMPKWLSVFKSLCK